MRSTSLALRVALIAGLMAGTSAYAQGYSNPNGGGGNNNGAQRFGSATCAEKIPCPSSSTYISASDLAANANACMVQELGLSIKDGYFDQTAGLDSNYCLSVRSELLAKKDSKLIMPRCCVITLPDNSCTFHCDLVNGW